jgi:hypothetical protein
VAKKSFNYSIRFTPSEHELAIAARQRMGEQTIADAIRSLLAEYARQKGLACPQTLTNRHVESRKYSIRFTGDEHELVTVVREQMGEETIAGVIRNLLAGYAMETASPRAFSRARSRHAVPKQGAA